MHNGHATRVRFHTFRIDDDVVVGAAPVCGGLRVCVCVGGELGETGMECVICLPASALIRDRSKSLEDELPPS